MTATKGLSGRPYHLLNVDTGYEMAGLDVAGRKCLTLKEATAAAEDYARRGYLVCIVCEVEDAAAPWDRRRRARQTKGGS